MYFDVRAGFVIVEDVYLKISEITGFYYDGHATCVRCGYREYAYRFDGDIIERLLLTIERERERSGA